MQLRVYRDVVLLIRICMAWILDRAIDNERTLPMTVDKDIDRRLSKDHEKY